MASLNVNSRNKHFLRLEPLEDRRMLAGPDVIGLNFVDAPDGERYFDILFDQELDASSVSASDIEMVVIGGRGGASIESVEANRIRLSPWTEWVDGHYHLLVGPDITNLDGERMDRDGDGIAGEPFDDRHFFHFDLDETEGPSVYMIQDRPGELGQTPIRGFDLTFNAPIDADTFDGNDIALLDGQGNPIDIEPTVVRHDSFSFTVDFANSVEQSGDYILHVGPGIHDINGNAMDGNGDGVFGQIDDGFVRTLSVHTPRPIPNSPGNGVFVELFLDVNELFDGTPVSRMLQGRSPDATAMATAIDFPNDAEDVLIWEGDTLGDFFTESTTFEPELLDLLAANFMLRNHFLLPVRSEYDLDLSTPEIDIRFGVASDDGFQLSINNEFVGFEDDRGFRYTWFDLAFENEGLYPVELVYSANERNESGLELGWETAISGGERVVPAESLYFDNSLLTAGDVNLNGTVDSSDLGLLLNNFGDDSGLGWTDGNLNDDAIIDSTDLGLLLNNFGFPFWQNASQPPATALATAAQVDRDAADVDGSGTIAPIDVLRVVNFLNSNESENIRIDDATPPEIVALDVDHNGEVVSLDAMLVMNRLEEARYTTGASNFQFEDDTVEDEEEGRQDEAFDSRIEWSIAEQIQIRKPRG